VDFVLSLYSLSLLSIVFHSFKAIATADAPVKYTVGYETP